jgi:hypothetical protein
MACYGPLHLSDPGKAIRSTDTSSSPCPLRGRYSSCATWRSRGNSARPSGQDPSARLSNGFASQSCPASRAARPYRPTPRALSPVRTPAVTRQQPQPAQTRTAPDFHAARPPTGCNELTGKLSAVNGSISLTVFPAVGLAGLSGREPVAEGDGECVQGRLPPYGPSCPPGAGRVQGPGDQVQAFQRRVDSTGQRNTGLFVWVAQ